MITDVHTQTNIPVNSGQIGEETDAMDSFEVGTSSLDSLLGTTTTDKLQPTTSGISCDLKTPEERVNLASSRLILRLHQRQQEVAKNKQKEKIESGLRDKLEAISDEEDESNRTDQE